MAATKQISAHISPQTKERLEKYARAHGAKKGFLIEQALLHHLQALHELPQEVIIPPRLVLSPSAFEAIVELLEDPPAPTDALVKLLNED